MDACEIKVSGSAFGVDEFLKSSNLKPGAIWRRGEMLSSETAAPFDSGFRLVISDGVDRPLDFHVKEATRFLAVQEPELLRAVRSGAEDLRLIIGLNRNDPSPEYLPPKLLLLAGRLDIGIELT
jgi:hypothetical protein